jgi:hypothetical protein
MVDPIETAERSIPAKNWPCCPVVFYALLAIAGVMGLCGILGVAGGIWRIAASTGNEGSWTILTGTIGLGLQLLGFAAIIGAILLHMWTRPSLIWPADREPLITAIDDEPRIAEAPVASQPDRDLANLSQSINLAVEQLKEIKENTLLDDRAKKNKREQFAEFDRKSVFVEIDRLARTHEWARAKTLLDGLQHKYPDHADVRQAFESLEQLRKQAFKDDVARTKKTIHDFMAISAWDRAAAHAEVLLEKHPDMNEPKELLAHVFTERQKFREEHLKRISNDVQQSINRKRWSDALQGGRQLIDKYPDSVEAEALRNQLETLETNTEIEKRQQLEEQIKDLIHRRKFVQALELAKHVIETYPGSPQAQALRAQTVKLEELARQQEKEIEL